MNMVIKKLFLQYDLRPINLLHTMLSLWKPTYIIQKYYLNWLGQVNFRTHFPQKFPTCCCCCLVRELYVNALTVMAHFAEQTTRFLMMPTVFYCCSFLIRQAKVFLWIFSKQKNTREIFVNEKQNDCEIRTPNPQPLVFPLAMLSFVICIFHKNMRCIRSYIVSIYLCMHIGTLCVC